MNLVHKLSALLFAFLAACVVNSAPYLAATPFVDDRQKVVLQCKLEEEVGAVRQIKCNFTGPTETLILISCNHLSHTGQMKIIVHRSIWILSEKRHSSFVMLAGSAGCYRCVAGTSKYENVAGGEFCFDVDGTGGAAPVGHHPLFRRVTADKGGVSAIIHEVVSKRKKRGSDAAEVGQRRSGRSKSVEHGLRSYRSQNGTFTAGSEDGTQLDQLVGLYIAIGVCSVFAILILILVPVISRLICRRLRHKRAKVEEEVVQTRFQQSRLPRQPSRITRTHSDGDLCLLRISTSCSSPSLGPRRCIEGEDTSSRGDRSRSPHRIAVTIVPMKTSAAGPTFALDVSDSPPLPLNGLKATCSGRMYTSIDVCDESAGGPKGRRQITSCMPRSRSYCEIRLQPMTENLFDDPKYTLVSIGGTPRERENAVCLSPAPPAQLCNP